MKIYPVKENVKLTGRTFYSDGALILTQSGSGIEFEYAGQGFDLTLIAGDASVIPDNEENYARIAVYAGDERIEDTLLTSRTGVLSIDASKYTLKDGRHSFVTFRVIKLSEIVMSLAGIVSIDTHDDGAVRPAPAAPHRIEFIGDSITCGYGVDDEDPLHQFKTATEDVTKAFAYKTARALNAEYSIFASSGYGILSGYTDDVSARNTLELIPKYYESIGLSRDSIESVPDTLDTKWDFTEYEPDVIVINLGTNDDSYCQDDEKRQSEYAGLYAEFLKKVRSHNDKAMIFCVLGIMGDRLYPYVKQAVSEYMSSTGDEDIICVHLPEQDAEAGFVADFHPLESAHEKASAVLADAVRKIMGWQV